MKRLTIYLVLVFLCVNMASAQKLTDTPKTAADTVRNERLNTQIKKVQQISAERLADSLKRAELQAQVDRLSSADNQKKAELLNELNLLKQQDSLRLIRQKRQVDSLRRFVKGFPVSPFRDTIFNIYVRQGSFTARERAEAVEARLTKLADDYSFSTDSLKLTATEQTTDVVYKDNLIISVSDMDAIWMNTNRQELAERLRLQAADAVVAYRDETSWQTLLKEAVLALLVIGVVVVLIHVFNLLFHWLKVKMEASKRLPIKGIRIRNYQLLTPSRQLSVFQTLLNLVKWLVILLVIYFALTILFGIFPFTRDISEALLGYILSPLRKIGQAVWDYIPNLITIIVLITVFRYVLRFFRFLKVEIEREQLKIPGFFPDWANPTYQLIRVLVLAFLFIVMYDYLPGSDSPIFKGVSVFVGVIFTFGSTGALSNVVAGLVLTYMRAFKIGDRVKIGEVIGDIIEKNMLVTRLRTIQNEIISIPNSTVMNNHTINYSSDALEKGLIVNTTVTIGYDVPWRQVHELLINAAKKTDMVEKKPEPYVLQTSLDDYYVSYRINAYTKSPNKQAVIYSSLHANIQDEFNKAGVEIMSPHYKALRDGNAVTIPSEYLPKDYVAPVFETRQQDKKK